MGQVRLSYLVDNQTDEILGIGSEKNPNACDANLVDQSCRRTVLYNI